MFVLNCQCRCTPEVLLVYAMIVYGNLFCVLCRVSAVPLLKILGTRGDVVSFVNCFCVGVVGKGGVREGEAVT